MKKQFYPISRVYLLCTLLLLSTKTLCAYNSANNNPKKEHNNDRDSLHLNLEEIVLQASYVTDRKTPLRVYTVDQKEIAKKSVGFTYPELLKNMPGLYATSETGSYGDARINIRGFKQENISVLLNGIPISGLVTGNMFWNNWLGLSDATYSIQVQKGIGGSMLSDNSVGGTINIITRGAGKEPSADLGLSITDYGQYKYFTSISTGENKKGWSLSALGSYTWGSGYPNSTDVNSWAYMVNLSKRINSKNSLLFTLLGSPERHKQRSSRLTAEEIKEYGLKYNKNWGYHNGKERNLSENFYHKPYFTLHHFYKPSTNRELSSALYISVGDGGGKWSESKGKRIIDFRRDGLVDWDGAQQANIMAGPAAQNIVADYLAGHTQIGAKSNYSIQLSKWNINSGFNYQNYTTWEKERITDLLGAEYWLEQYDKKSLAGVAGRDPIKRVGDYIRTYGGKKINHLTIYSSATYSNKEWEGRVGASVMGSSNQRWDNYNYPTNPYSKIAYGSGASLKGGLSRTIGRSLLFYANAALYSRVPYNDLYFSSGNNNITQGVKNESNILAEIGGRWLFDRGAIEATLYYALWKNKSIISNPYKQPDESNNRYLIRGLNALHTGLEINGSYRISRELSLEAYASLGNWKWQNDVSASIYDPYSSLLIEEINVYTKGLPVGDAPQIQISAQLSYNPTKQLELYIESAYNDKMYADFNPSERQNSGDRALPYRIPSYSVTNLGISWSPNLRLYSTASNQKRGNMLLFIRVNNLFNQEYIERGKDGVSHDLKGFSGFWGMPLNGSLGVKIGL